MCMVQPRLLCPTSLLMSKWWLLPLPLTLKEQKPLGV